MGTTGAGLNHEPNHWPLRWGGGSWILSIPAATEDCENQKTQTEIFLGLKRLKNDAHEIFLYV